MIPKDSIEEAYCFFHQKWNVYARSSSETQKDDIEYAIGMYANGMNRELYAKISEGKDGFLLEHSSFSDDLQQAVGRLELLL
jgi:predicted site-specific integrase-resolvase